MTVLQPMRPDEVEKLRSNGIEVTQVTRDQLRAIYGAIDEDTEDERDRLGEDAWHMAQVDVDLVDCLSLNDAQGARPAILRDSKGRGLLRAEVEQIADRNAVASGARLSGDESDADLLQWATDVEGRFDDEQVKRLNWTYC